MREILDFFKDIFMIKEDNHLNIGLTQFKKQTIIKPEIKPVIKKQRKELKISDLMRGNIS